MWNLVFFARRLITDACLFVCLFFSQGSSYRTSGPRMSQEGSFYWKWKVLVPFLCDQKIGGHLGPLPRSFFTKSTDQNFEIAILFIIVENRNYYVFGMTYSPTVPREVASSYKLWPVFTYSNGYWEECRCFSGGLFWFERMRGRGYVGEDLSFEEYVMGE